MAAEQVHALFHAHDNTHPEKRKPGRCGAQGWVSMGLHMHDSPSAPAAHRSGAAPANCRLLKAAGREGRSGEWACRDARTLEGGTCHISAGACCHQRMRSRARSKYLLVRAPLPSYTLPQPTIAAAKVTHHEGPGPEVRAALKEARVQAKELRHEEQHAESEAYRCVTERMCSIQALASCACPTLCAPRWQRVGEPVALLAAMLAPGLQHACGTPTSACLPARLLAFLSCPLLTPPSLPSMRPSPYDPTGWSAAGSPCCPSAPRRTPASRRSTMRRPLWARPASMAFGSVRSASPTRLASK